MESERYDIGECIYEGAHSRVSQGRRVADDLPVIVKQHRDLYPSPRALAALVREHENVPNGGGAERISSHRERDDLTAPHRPVFLIVAVFALSLASVSWAGGAAGASARFDDVSESSPFAADIAWLAETGIATGFPDGSFRPGEPITRQAMAAFLYRFAGSPNGVDPLCASAPFPAVSTAHPFCGEITWLVDEGIGAGFADGTFRGDALITRQAMAAFLFRLEFGPDGGPDCTPGAFDDIGLSHPFCKQINWLGQTGISTGYPDGDFKPGGWVTREAMAAYLHRYSMLPSSHRFSHSTDDHRPLATT